MKTASLTALATAALLAACAAPVPPVVTSFNGDSVEVTTPAAVHLPDGATFNEATRICGQAGKRAEYASSRPGRDQFIHLFLCLGVPQSAAYAPPQPAGFAPPQTIIVR